MRRQKQTVQIWNPVQRWIKVSCLKQITKNPSVVFGSHRTLLLCYNKRIKLKKILQCYLEFPDDIPSDAEAEARLHQSECAEVLPEEGKRPESLRMSSSIGACH